MDIDNILELTKLGWRVHPLQARNKIPILGRWGERATTDEATIRLWLSQYPDCNIGIATGEVSGIFVVDLDPKNGGDQSWEFLLDENAVPNTVSVKTGSGGTHLYFVYPKGKDIRNSSNKIGKGIDIRGNGGQVVSPGSIHPNGTTYEWINSPATTKVANAPKWLLDLITDEDVNEFTTLGNRLEKGSRNNSIYHVSLALARQGVDKSFAVSTVMKWLKDQGQDDIDISEVTKTIDSAFEAADAKPVDVSERSDTMNAEILVNTYGEDLIFIPGMNWFHWNGKVWEPDLDGAITSQLFIACMKAFQEDAASRIVSAKSKTAMREAGALANWAVRSLSATAIKAAVDLASTFAQVRRTADEVDSVETLWLLNCNNGTIDLRTGELRKHNKKDLITKMVPIDYDPTKTAPFWESTLSLIFDGKQDLIDYMQRALGYSITGSQDERCFFICWGEAGANGKSTVLETIQDILGPGYSQMSDMVVITSSTTDNRVSSSLAKLQGSRFVSMNEAEENQRLSEALIKQLTGGDTVQACYKYKNPFEYRPVFKLWVRTNERPVIRSQTNAIWDRVKLIPFERSIPKELRLPRSEVDRRLREEAQGILTWLVRGAGLWAAEGNLIDPPEVMAAVQGYRVDSDLVRIFMDEAIEINGNSRVKAQEVYMAFSMWAKDSGEKWVMTKTRFTRRLKMYGVEVERSNGQTWFSGIKLTQAASMYIM